MKNKTSISLLCFVTLFAWIVCACDDTMNGDATPSFPADTLLVDAYPGDTVPVSFKAGYTWFIESNKDWCLVEVEGSKSFSGKAGANTVKFVINDQHGNLFEDEKALITLHMNSESRVIACITRRTSKEYEVEVSCNGKILAEGESIVIGTSGELTLNLNPNFDAPLSYEFPTWIKLHRDSEKAITLNVVEDSLKYTINRECDSLRLFKDSTFSRSFHVQYTGMSSIDDAITISPETQWGVKVSADGMSYMTLTSVSAGISFPAPMKVAIESSYGYQLIHMAYDEETGFVTIPDEDSWLKVTDNKKDSIEINFAPNTGNVRTAYLLALPIALAENPDELKTKLFGDSISEDAPLELIAEAERFVVAQFIQDADEECSMKVINAFNGWKYLPVEKETDPKWLDMAAEKGVPANKVFRADLKSGDSFLLNPLLPEEVWNPGKPTKVAVSDSVVVGDSIVVSVDTISVYLDSIAVYGESGVLYLRDEHFEAEPTKMEEEEGDYMLVQFRARYEIEEEYYIIYFVADDKYLKALVVWNYWNE